MQEQDKSFLERIYEYAKRYWKMPAPCLYLWDRYGLETKLINRQSMICRADVDYAYDDDFNLRIINTLNTTSPFVNQILSIESVAYNSDGDIEDGHLVLYIKYEDDDAFYCLIEAPISFRIKDKKDFDLVTKYYTPDETDYDETINIDEEVNISEVVNIHVRDYTDADYYVADYGDDNNTGGIDDPFRTLQHAINTVYIGGTVCLLSDLDLTDSVVLFKDCNIIGKEISKVESTNGLYLTLLPNTRLYIRDIVFTKNNVEVYNFVNGYDVWNDGDTIVTVESTDIKPVPSYDLDLISKDYWFSGEEVVITLKDKAKSINSPVYLFDSYNSLIGVINADSSGSYDINYIVPTGLDTDKILLIIPKNNYTYSKTFKVYNINSDWYVDTENGSDTNTGLSIEDAFATLECGLAHVEKLKNRVFFKGTETITDLQINDTVFIRGLTTMSVLNTDSEIYFSISTGQSLNLSDLILNADYVTNTNFKNQGAFPLSVIKSGIIHALFVDGDNGDDNNDGTSWENALKTIQKALSLKTENIYFTGKNTINEELHIYRNVRIMGSLNNSEIHSNTGTFFSIEKGNTLKLSNMYLISDDEINYIENNTYQNKGANPLEVLCFIDKSKIYVDGDNGDDNNKGTSKEQALKTLKKGLSLNPNIIYFTGTNTIDEELKISKDIEIKGDQD